MTKHNNWLKQHNRKNNKKQNNFVFVFQITNFFILSLTILHCALGFILYSVQYALTSSKSVLHFFTLFHFHLKNIKDEHLQFLLIVGKYLYWSFQHLPKNLRGCSSIPLRLIGQKGFPTRTPLQLEILLNYCSK